jgi:hypothetical protein
MLPVEGAHHAISMSSFMTETRFTWSMNVRLGRTSRRPVEEDAGRRRRERRQRMRQSVLA